VGQREKTTPWCWRLYLFAKRRHIRLGPRQAAQFIERLPSSPSFRVSSSTRRALASLALRPCHVYRELRYRARSIGETVLVLCELSLHKQSH
jgi:hypothetical protein